jgi:transposase
MHVRVSRVKRNGRTYEYAQLVESYRRPADGMPMHRVIATLGEVTALEVQNMREALAASRKGKRVAVARVARPVDASALKPRANLRYLDLAVLLELWREWGLDKLLDELMPPGEERLRPAAVVAALSLQRCVDPGSTLYATRWLPRTALVELLDLEPKSFNNTRLHRVLDDLDAATATLMSKLARRYEERDGAFVSLFLDVSDTWFVGHGPLLAKHGKTKEGLTRRKIGIVLLCNERGYPLRWEVIYGNQNDGVAMSGMMRAIAGLSWVGEAPVVCDRAMGTTSHLVEMLATQLRFLTAMTVTEFDAYAPTLPHATFAALDPHGQDAEREREVEQATTLASQTEMTKVADDLFVLDLGVVVRADVPTRPSSEAPSDAEDATVAAMRLCREILRGIAEERFASYAAAGRAAGLSQSLTIKYLRLRRLSEQQQREVLEGKAAGCTLAELLTVAAEPDPDARQRAFAAALAAAAGRPPRPKAPRAEDARGRAPAPPAQEPVRVRVVVYFNPNRFVSQRASARKKLQRVEAFVKKLNTKLETSRANRSTARIAAAVDRELRKDALLEAFEVHIEQPTKARPRYRVDLRLRQSEWALRRRYDGFVVLAAHPSVSQSPADLCKLYRAKDAVEKDFQVIKSVVELRPVWHRTDAKVRAHVTLCVLALLLERTLHHKLKGRYSAEAAIELLETCRLNLYAGQRSPPAYAITHADPDQKAILRALHLQHLADDDEVADRISPRSVPPLIVDAS